MYIKKNHTFQMTLRNKESGEKSHLYKPTLHYHVVATFIPKIQKIKFTPPPTFQFWSQVSNSTPNLGRFLKNHELGKKQ
jgi:hypothetical protein